MPDIVKVEDGVASTRQRPQSTRVRPTRLQYYEVTGDDEVTSNGELVHFSLLTDVEPINYSKALKNMKWKSTIPKSYKQSKETTHGN